MNDKEITDFLKKSGVVDSVLPFSEGSMRILRRFVSEVEKHTLKKEFICSKCGLRKDSEHESQNEF